MRANATLHDLFIAKECSSPTYETNISKQSHIVMLKIPVIPHGGSGEEDEILRVACPFETDILFGHVRDALQHPEETRCFENECDYLDERSDELLRETRNDHDHTLHDMFFEHMASAEQEIENQNREIWISRINRKGKEAEFIPSRQSPVSIIQFEADPVAQCKNHYLRSNPMTIEEEATQQINQIIDTRNRASKNYSQEIQEYLLQDNYQQPQISQSSCKPIFKRCMSASSQETDVTLSSAFSNMSYDNASIMKLKARKRMLEIHLTKSLNGFRMSGASSPHRDNRTLLAVSTCS